MRRWITIIIGVVLVAVGCGVLIKDTFGDNIEAAAEAMAVNIVGSKINRSLKEGFYDETMGDPILHVERDSEGNIEYVEPDSRVINKLLLSFTQNLEESYSLSDMEEHKVNLGVLTGSRILSQLPLYITVKVQPLSLTKFQYETEFETEGINQTRYYVYCTVTSQVHILAPFTDKVSEINRRILLAEAIIVGKVPDSYVVVPEEDILDVT
ncbi:MAG: hypothetical protein DBY08_01350 [Clostridiales bacterium]|nr:sporulation protein YunB [Bacillota bacterium]MEE0516726.1 sporulation protein YunB [Anaerovoracaceae bacterium]PWL94520.1 MAG: hypothetical protein DBY08_01350 [Clostridiales bacterium]